MTSYKHCSARAGLSLALFLSIGAHGCGAALPETADEAVGSVESRASALVTKVTPIDGFAIPVALLDRPRQVVIRSVADANTFLGSVPPGVDFTKEFLVFYAGGAQPTLGYKTSLSLDNVFVERTSYAGDYRYTLRVSSATALDPPGSGCATELPGISLPFTLVRVDATGLRHYDKVSSHVLSNRHTTLERTCRTPGAACDGTLTTDGLDAISTRPSTGGSVPLYTTGRSYAENYLAPYTLERWQEECTAGSCSWRKLTEAVGVPQYTSRGSVYHYSDGGASRLVLFSGEGFDTFYSGGGRTYPCWLWAESIYNRVDTRSGKGELSGVALTDNRNCLVAGGVNYHGKDIGLDGFAGVMGDRCVRLTSQTGTPGVSSVLQVLTAQW